jgi:glycine betaine/proline transport system substrate-binding protein
MGNLSDRIVGFLVSLLLSIAVVQSANASAIIIGVPTWPSARVTANIIEQLLENEMGFETELREKSPLGILSGIDRGEFHIHPEIWLPNLEKPVERYAYNKGSLKLSSLSSVARQNICTTDQTIKLTGIEKVSDLANPNMAKWFDSNADGKGEIWIGAPSWSSINIEKIRARSYGYDETMSLLLMEEDVAMAAVDVAAALGEPIVFYCYSPHHVFQLHDIRILQEPVHDPETWNIVAPVDDPNWLKNSKAGSAWKPSSFRIGFAASLETEMPTVSKLLSQMQFNPSQTTWMSYQVQVEGIAPVDVAKMWIAENQDKVREWLMQSK